MEIQGELAQAIRDYRLLLDRGYPVQGTLKLVGDRYRLTKEERILLFRGILDKSTSATIHSRLLAEPPQNMEIAIDGYNILFTLINYRRGHPLFIGTDGLLRDAGGAHGRIQEDQDFTEAGALLLWGLEYRRIRRAIVFLDSPIPKSARHAQELSEAAREKNLDIQTIVVPSADPPVRDFSGPSQPPSETPSEAASYQGIPDDNPVQFCIASSDSAIAYQSKLPIFDLARDILQTRFRAQFPVLSQYVE